MRRIPLLAMVVLCGLCRPAAGYEDQVSATIVEHLSDRVIVVKTVAGYPSQMAVATDDGLVVFGTLYDPDLTRTYRRLIEAEFGRNDFRYVICSSSRILDHAGTAVYPEAALIAHRSVRDDMIARQGRLDAVVAEEIRVFTTKAARSRGILAEDPPNPDADQGQYNWMMFCQNIADCLAQQAYSERVPDEVFERDRTLELGGCPIELIDFGPGIHGEYLLINLPTEGLLLAPAFSPLHLAPLPGPGTDAATVRLWLDVLDRLLERNPDIRRVYCGVGSSMTPADLVRRRDYVRKLWTGVTAATREGLDFATAAERLSIDREFTDVKAWPIWAGSGENWVRWDHNTHLEAYWRFQHECAAEAVAAALDRAGPAAAEALFREMRDDPRHRHVFLERRFNDLGYRLLNDGRIEAAIAVLRMNTEMFPESGNTHDSLGEVLLGNGQTAAALQSYGRALELDPGNANARRVIEEHRAR